MAAMNRLADLSPSNLDKEQKRLYDAMYEYTTSHYGDKFEYIDNEKRFIGPFGIHMHSPAVGEAFLNFAKALRTLNVPPELRECAILGVGARTKAAYEIAAHRQVSGFRQFELDQMDQGKIPDSFSPQQKAAFNLALELGKPGPLDRTSYDGFVKVLGEDNVRAIIHLVGFYGYVSVVLNGFDAKVPSPK